MRFVAIAPIPHDSGNAFIKDGSLPDRIQKVMAEVKPEAAYFTEMDGLRTGIFVVDIKEPSDLPRVAEPFFLLLDSPVEFHPAMVPADLQKADIVNHAKKFV